MRLRITIFDARTGNIDPAGVEAAITPRTRAISVVHYPGLPVDMDAINVLAKRHNLFVVEDCALAVGASIDGVAYVIEGSLTLASNDFTSAVSEVTPAQSPAQSGLPDITGSGWEYHTFRLSASEGLTGRGFLRAKANSSP